MQKNDSKDKKRLKPELHFSEYSAYGIQKDLEKDLHAKAKVFGLPSQDLLLNADDVVRKDDAQDGVERIGNKFGMRKQQ
ncbi:MAG: hypothetical protein WC408_04135 [Candidatus Micrarchaeia archaeon]|jgi:hypothetical protein